MVLRRPRIMQMHAPLPASENAFLAIPHPGFSGTLHLPSRAVVNLVSILRYRVICSYRTVLLVSSKPRAVNPPSAAKIHFMHAKKYLSRSWITDSDSQADLG